MDALKTSLLESPFYVYIFLAGVMVVVAIVMRNRTFKDKAVPMAVVMAVAAGIFAIEALVVTDREQIIAALREMRTEMIPPDDAQVKLTATERHLHDNVRVNLGEFGGRDLNKRQTLMVGRRLLTAMSITDIRFLKMVVTVEQDHAKAHFCTIITFDTRDMGSQRTSLIWDLEWRKQPDGWRITDVARPQSGVEY